MATPQASAPAAPAAAAAAARTFTRQQLLELARAGRPWEFLPLAAAALRQAPQDGQIRLLAAASFVRLGLATPARDMLAALPGPAADEPAVCELSQAIGRLPPDLLEPAARLETCRRNVEALCGRGVDLRQAIQQWSAHVTETVVARSSDGNVVRRPAAGSDWTGLHDMAGAAEQFAQAHVVGPGHEYHPPYAIEGLDPPWLLLAVLTHTPPTINGYRPRISVLQADPLEALDGLSVADLREAIRDPRVLFFIGADAGGRFDADLRGRFAAQIQGPFVGLPGVRTRLRPRGDQVLHAAQRDQQAAVDGANERVRAIYGTRDPSWWDRRYAEALGGSGPPLRVLIPTTRYSTYIRHASRDLADAFSALGAEAELLIEPDDSTRFSSLAYLESLDRFRPDLVVLVNYTRANTGGLFPPQLPFVCWLQDAMWHQFDEAVGARQSDMDFLVGHVFEDLFERFGYPRRNALSIPITVSDRKFHDGPIGETLLRRHACEIAYVGHQSETPQAQRERLLKDLSARPEIRRCVESIYPAICEIAAHPDRKSASRGLRALVDESLAAAGSPDPLLATRLLKMWILPMADRILRHESLHWAADVADRRGWRLRIYGRGWESHPRLGHYACGELAHGEELRASYQAAAAHLHLTINTSRHQRLVECVLSGGLALCRRSIEDLHWLYLYACDRLARECVPSVCRLLDRWQGFAVADHPAAMAGVAAAQRCGVPRGPFFFLSDEEIEQRRAAGERLDRDEAWLLGDPAEITFACPADLEALVERAIERPAWRRNLSASIARRARRHFTTERLAGRIVEMVRDAFRR